MIIDYLIAPFLKKKGAFIYNDFIKKNVIKFVIIKVQKEAKNNNKKEVIS